MAEINISDLAANGTKWTKLLGTGDELLNPGGFSAADKAASVVTRDDGLMTLTIAPTGVSYNVWVAGTRYTKTAPESVPWPNVEGYHFFYFDTTGVLRTTMDRGVLDDVLKGRGTLVASTHWVVDTATTQFFTDERPGFMPQDVRYPWTVAFGTRWLSGGALGDITIGNGSLESHAQCSVFDSAILFGDINRDILDGAPQDLSPILRAPVYYRSGPTGIWRRKEPDNYPFIQSGAVGYVGVSGRAAYSAFVGGTWTLASPNNGDCIGVLILATTDATLPVIAVLGQHAYTGPAQARDRILSELRALAQLAYWTSKRITPLGAIIIQTSSSYANSVKARLVEVDTEGNTWVDLRGYTLGSSAGGAAAGQTVPRPTSPGQILYSLDGISWSAVTPVLDAFGDVVSDDNYTLVVS